MTRRIFLGRERRTSSCERIRRYVWYVEFKVTESEGSCRFKAGTAYLSAKEEGRLTNLKRRTTNKQTYPSHIYDNENCNFLPILLVHNKGSWIEGHMIDLTWSGKENTRKKGRFPVGTNRKGVNNDYGDVGYSKDRPGSLYFIPTHKKYARLEDYDTAFNKHQKAPASDKEIMTPSRKLSDFFEKKKASASTSSEPQDPSQELMLCLEEDLFPEQVEAMFPEEDSKDSFDNMNHVVTGLLPGWEKMCGKTSYSNITQEQYKRLRKERFAKWRANARVRGAGGYVPTVTCRATIPANLRRISGRRSCLTCPNEIHVPLKDGTGKGYCISCAGQHAPELLSEKKSVNECSVIGCTKVSKITVKGKRYCDKCNPDEGMKQRRAEEKKLYDQKQWLKKKAKLSK